MMCAAAADFRSHARPARGAALGSHRALRFTSGPIFYAPYAAVLHGLRIAFEEADFDRHRAIELAALGDLAISNSARTLSISDAVISYVTGARSVGGLESLYLTAVHCVWLHGAQRVYRAAARDLVELDRPEPRDEDEAGRRICFVDTANSMVTMVARGQAGRMWDDLLAHGLRDSGIAGALRGGGYGAASDAASDFLNCWATMVTIAGTAAGAAGTLVGGPALGAAAGLYVVVESGLICNGTTDWDSSSGHTTPDRDKSGDQSAAQRPGNDQGTNKPTGDHEEPEKGDKGAGGGGGAPPSDDEPNQSVNGIDDPDTLTCHTYPLPPDLERSGIIEFASDPSPESDGVPPTPDGHPGPPHDPALRRNMTFLINGLPRMGDAGDADHLGFLSQEGRL